MSLVYHLWFSAAAHPCHLVSLTPTFLFPSNNGFFGELEYYDEEYERVSVKKPRSLQRLDKRMFFYVATCDDEVCFLFMHDLIDSRTP